MMPFTYAGSEALITPGLPVPGNLAEQEGWGDVSSRRETLAESFGTVAWYYLL